MTIVHVNPHNGLLFVNASRERPLTLGDLSKLRNAAIECGADDESQVQLVDFRLAGDEFTIGVLAPLGGDDDDEVPR
jgi:hypothetical protein